MQIKWNTQKSEKKILHFCEEINLILKAVFKNSSTMKKQLLLLFFITTIFTTSIAQPPMDSYVPTITLKNEKDSLISLASLKGKVVLIDFWASWCGPCRQANKHLRKLYSKYKEQGFEIFSISADYNKAPWKQAIKADKITWLQVYDEGGIVANKWRINYLPTTFLLNREGKIVAADLDGKELDKRIKSLL